MIWVIMQELSPLPSPFDRLARGEARPIELAAFEMLFHQGTTPQAVYFVVSGAVHLLRHTEAGQAVVLHRAKTGDLIAEAALFSKTYHCDCVADVDSRLIALNKSAILRRMGRNPDFSEALAKRFARQIQHGRRQLELRSIASARQRVLAGVADGWLEGTVMEFAADMGLTHEATYRALSALVKDGLMVKVGRGKYSIITR